ncbi:MAG: 50S ribosomal protein L31 [Candidatus Omnitrophica bacterium]|nr:50S ribosomal protein L31 [Candidatus Omnitrophota bacterium]
MKEGIHPDYKLATVACACGSVFRTRSTKGDFRVEICSKCHPFYTGRQKFVDTAGRVERFRKKFGKKG